MKTWKSGLLALLIIVGIIFTNQRPIKAAEQEAFVIDYFEVELYVSETGIIDVKEKLDVTFTEPRHGIYLDIPTRYNMTWEIDNQTVRRNYRFPVSDIKVTSHEYAVENYEAGKRIRIGSANAFVDGKVEYEVSYTIKTSDLDLNGKQMLYYNLIAPAWNTAIKSASFIIHMPKAFDKNNIYFYFGSYGSTQDQLSGFTYDVVGSTIYGNLSVPLYQLQGVTLEVELPNEYFLYPKPINYSGFILAFSILLTIAIGFLFFRYGKDDIVVKTVMFEAPKGLTCASISYVLDGDVAVNDVLSLLIEWANEGYLSLEEISSDNLQITKEKEMGDERKRYEKRLFNSLFQTGDVVETKKLETAFYANIQSAVRGVHQYHGKKENRVFTKTSLWIKVLSFFLTIIPTFLGMLDSLNKVFYSFASSMIVSSIVAMIGIGILVLWGTTIQKFIVRKKAASIALIITAFILSILYFVVYYFIIMIGTGNQWLIISGIISTVIIAVFAFFMDKRTNQGRDWLGQILGLKDFIMTAEKDRLEMLVHDNPQYFYHILPYAYVLGVSDVWSKKFTDIIMENAKWYRSDEAVPVYMFMPRYYRSMTTLRQLSTLPEMKVSSGGGKFSGGGGGGFSGGGFGGGGGGSW